MTKKKILIVSRSFYPQNSPRSFRTTELAKEFARQGHEVTVLTKDTNFDHQEFEKEHQLTVKYFGKGVLPKIQPKKNQGRASSWLLRAVNKLLNILIYYPYVEDVFQIPKALKNKKGYDLMISIAFPHSVHWGVARAIKRNPSIANVWVADCGDPFMGNKLDTPRLFYFKYLEKWTFQLADFITVPVKEAIQAYYPEFHQKIRVIPQGFEFRGKPNYTPANNPVPTFLYGGLFIPNSRDPRPFMDYLLNTGKDFRFYVYTHQKELIQSRVDASNGKIIHKDYVPKEQLEQEMQRMDFLVNFDNNVEEMMPSKLIEYTLTGKPILNIKKNLDTEVIDQFLTGDYKQQFDLNNINDYNIQNVAKKFLDLIKNYDRH